MAQETEYKARISKLEECLRNLVLAREKSKLAFLHGNTKMKDEAMLAFEDAYTECRLLIKNKT